MPLLLLVVGMHTAVGVGADQDDRPAAVVVAELTVGFGDHPAGEAFDDLHLVRSVSVFPAVFVEPFVGTGMAARTSLLLVLGDPPPIGDRGFLVLVEPERLA